MLKKASVSCLFIFLFSNMNIVKGESGFICSTVDKQLNIEIPCINYQNQAYQASLNFVPDANNPENLCWTLANANITTDKGSCATASDDLNLSLPCVDLNGKSYKAHLKYSDAQKEPAACQFLLDSAELTAVSAIENVYVNGCDVDYPPTENRSYVCSRFGDGGFKVQIMDSDNKDVGVVSFAADGKLTSFKDYLCGVLYEDCPRFFSNQRSSELGTFVYEWLDENGDFYQYNVSTKLKGDGTTFSTALRRTDYKIRGKILSEDRSQFYEYGYKGYKGDKPHHWVYTDEFGGLSDRFLTVPEVTSCTLVRLDLFTDDKDHVCRDKVIEETEEFLNNYSGEIAVPSWK